MSEEYDKHGVKVNEEVSVESSDSNEALNELNDTNADQRSPSKKWWFLSSMLIALLAGSIYSHPTMLNGELVYDDGSTVAKNPNVLGLTPWSEVGGRGVDTLIKPFLYGLSIHSLPPTNMFLSLCHYADSEKRLLGR
jgi:hypothetical protein